MRRISFILFTAAGVAVGAMADRAAFGWRDPARWVPDLVVGWTFIASGLIAGQRRPGSLSGALLLATGYAWFLGNFASVGIGPVSWIGAHALFLYRGPLIHLVLTYPSGRTRSRTTLAAIAAGYVASLPYPIWQNGTATIVLAVLLIAVAARDHVRAVGPSRRAHVPALEASAALALVLATEAAVRLTLPAGAHNQPLLLAYEVVLVGITVGLGLGLLSSPWERVDVADLVLRIGEARSGTLRGELSRALGDPTLDIGYWLPEANAFVDGEGRPISLPEPGAATAVTMIERDGESVAALVHDRSVLDDPGLVEAVSVAARLAASNARLQVEVRARLAELVASRRRLLDAGDDERRRLARRLQDGAERRLTNLASNLRAAHGAALDDATREQVEHAEARLVETIEEIRELSRGLHPRILTQAGLAGALGVAAERVPLPVRVSISADALPPAVEAAVYYVCSEAIANVVKYAAASRVLVSVTSNDAHVVAQVEDDGVGGADPNGGSGLRGLADRIETLGGSLRLESPRGGGTRLRAEIPLLTSGEAAPPGSPPSDITV